MKRVKIIVAVAFAVIVGLSVTLVSADTIRYAASWLTSTVKMSAATTNILGVTADGSDTQLLYISPGGGVDTNQSRGAYIRMGGNQQASINGNLELGLGNDGNYQLTTYLSSNTSSSCLQIARDRNNGQVQTKLCGDGGIYSLTNNGASYTNVLSASTLLSALSGATAVATNLVPAKTTNYGCVARVTTTITGATSWGFGDGTTATLYGATLALPSGTTTSNSDYTANPEGYHSGALSPTLTANGSNFTGGAVRVTCWYRGAASAPTS